MVSIAALDVRLGTLHARLKRATSALSESNQEPSDVRAAASLSLLAIFDFLNSLEEFAPFSNGPLRHLGEALLEADRGRLHPMMVPLSRSGRPAFSIASVAMQRWAVAYVEMLRDKGMMVKDAIKFVADVFASAGLRSSEGVPISAEALRRWRLEWIGPGADKKKAAQLKALMSKLKSAPTYVAKDLRASKGDVRTGALQLLEDYAVYRQGDD